MSASSLSLLAGLTVCGLLMLRRAVRLTPLRLPTSLRIPRETRGPRAGVPPQRRAVRTPRAGGSFESLPGPLREKLGREERRQRPEEQRN